MAGYATAMAQACTRAIQKLDEQCVAKLEEQAAAKEKVVLTCPDVPLPPLKRGDGCSSYRGSLYGNYYASPDIKRHVANALAPRPQFTGYVKARHAHQRKDR